MLKIFTSSFYIIFFMVKIFATLRETHLLFPNSVNFIIPAQYSLFLAHE
jgi:hypothetical protein